MPTTADRAEAPSAIQPHLVAIFISLELSRSIWLVTSLSPGAGEKMSKPSVRAGDVPALLARFSELKQKTLARTGKSFPIAGRGNGARHSASPRPSSTLLTGRIKWQIWLRGSQFWNVTPSMIFGNCFCLAEPERTGRP